MSASVLTLFRIRGTARRSAETLAGPAFWDFVPTYKYYRFPS
jgi:hypothetical protein